MTERLSSAEWRQAEWEGMSEREFQGHVLSLAEACGWRCYHTFDSRRSQPGFPDLVMVRDGRLVFAELKSEKGRVTQAQQEWIAELREVADDVESYIMDLGGEFNDLIVAQWWRPSDWDKIERTLK